jgi:hypothetical protein
MALILVEQKQNTVGTADEAERPWTMAAANAPNPLGIHLEPTHLTAAEVTVRGNHLVPVARISGGIEYRQEYLRTLGPSYHPDSSTSDPIFAGPEQEHNSLPLLNTDSDESRKNSRVCHKVPSRMGQTFQDRLTQGLRTLEVRSCRTSSNVRCI